MCHEVNICWVICLAFLILFGDVCSRSAASIGSLEPCVKMSLLTGTPLPADSGPVKWLGQAESAHKGDGTPTDMLLGWLASEHR